MKAVKVDSVRSARVIFFWNAIKSSLRASIFWKVALVHAFFSPHSWQNSSNASKKPVLGLTETTAFSFLAPRSGLTMTFCPIFSLKR